MVEASAPLEMVAVAGFTAAFFVVREDAPGKFDALRAISAPCGPTAPCARSSSPKRKSPVMARIDEWAKQSQSVVAAQALDMAVKAIDFEAGALRHSAVKARAPRPPEAAPGSPARS